VSNGSREAFAPGTRAWIEGIGSVRDAVRQELVAQQLAAHLPQGAGRLRVLDAGCGQGTQAIALARLGHEVIGVDNNDEMLSIANASADDEPGSVRERVRFVAGDVIALKTVMPRPCDVVCCHGVAMYLPSLAELVRALVRAVRPGGLISILTRNRAGIAMRAGMTQHWSDALLGFDATHYTDRLGIESARADDPADVRSQLDQAGADTIAWYGVRLFTDHWDRGQHVDDFEALIAAEAQAGERDPYRALAALTHTLAAVR
jgi:SAM-dependent methyltransferase